MQTSSDDKAIKILRDAGHSKSKSRTDSDLTIEVHLEDHLQRVREKELGKMKVLTPNEGVLAVVVQDEMADSRGLSTISCKEYNHIYVELSDVDLKKFPYRLGDLFMDKVLLKFIKEAIELLEPDGYFFTPTS
jgi:hypothetical protein